MSDFCSAKLAENHELNGFDCDITSLNDWLLKNACRANRAGTAVTNVWTSPNSDEVVAYYSIAPTQIHREELSRGQSGGYSLVPGYLLARLALDRSLQGQRLGGELLFDALETIVKASRISGGRLIVVDAINDDAANFYRHYGFQDIRGNQNRLVMKVATAAQHVSVDAVPLSHDTATRLISMHVPLPDGQEIAVVVSPAEAHVVAEALEKMEAHRLSASDLRQSLRTALGRDPFAT